MKKIFYSIRNFLEGLNTQDNAYQVGINHKTRSGQLTETQNVRITDEGNAISRKGYSAIGSQIEASKYVTSIFQYVDDYGNRTEYGICGAKLYEYDSENDAWGELSDFLGNTKTLSSNKRASMFTYKNNLIISNGEEPAFEYGKQTLYEQDVVYVADGMNDNIQSFDLSGTFARNFGTTGTGNVEVDYPRYIAADTTNKKIYVSDTGNHRIVRYDSDWNFEKYFGVFGAGDGQFNDPNGIYVDETNSKVYVCDSGNNRVQYFDLEGVYVGKFNGGDTGFDDNNGIAVDETNSYIYVTDTGNKRMQRFSMTGAAGSKVYSAYDSQWSTTSNCRGVAVDETNSKVFTADSTSSVIRYFDLDGSNAGSFGSTGITNGLLANPTDVAVDETNSYIYVCDRGNDRIQYFDLTAPFDYVGKFGTTGTGSGQFSQPYGVELGLGMGEVKGEVFHDLGTPLSFKAADGGGTGMTGTYTYKLTYANATYESSGGIQSNSVTLSNGDVTLTNISAPNSPSNSDNLTNLYKDITNINIYRQTGTSDFLFIGTIAKDADGLFSTSFDDTDIADGTTVVPTVNNLIPTFKYLTQFKNVLFGAGDYLYPNRIYWTNTFDPNDWYSGYWEPVGEGEGTIITGLAKLGDYLIVFKEDSIWYINATATDFEGFEGNTRQSVGVTEHLITEEYGCTSGFAISHVTLGNQNGLMFPDRDKGICFLSGNVVAPISDKVRSDWLALDKTLLGNAVSVYYEKYREYWISLTASGTTNNQVWAVDTKDGAIYKPFSLNVASLARVRKNGIEEIWSGDFNGYTWKQDDTDADNSGAIDAYFSTGWLHLNYPSYDKVFEELVINYIEKGSYNVTCYWAVDGEAFNATDSFTIDLSGTSGKRNKKAVRLHDTTAGRSPKGIHLRLRFRNENASEPFEILSVDIKSRIRKIHIP